MEPRITQGVKAQWSGPDGVVIGVRSSKIVAAQPPSPAVQGEMMADSIILFLSNRPRPMRVCAG